MDISRQEAVCLCEVESPVKAPMPRDSGPLSRSDSLRTFPFFNCLKCRSNRVGSTPLKPRCRIYFDPGVFSCAAGETSGIPTMYPAFPEQLAISIVLGPVPLVSNRDTPKRTNRGVSVPK